MKKVEVESLLIICCILLGVSFLTTPSYGGPTEPPPNIGAGNYAEFRNEPYFMGPNTITIAYYHNRTGSMTIYLYWFDTQKKYWVVPYGNGTLTYYASIDGVWRIECYLSGYLQYATDETHDIFNMVGGDLGEDWARHPTNPTVYYMASQIVGQTTSPYVAAQRIYLNISSTFIHDINYIPFRSDVDLVLDYRSTGHYHGVCRSDAVIVTAYARAMGIRARIIHLTFHSKGALPDEPHYFAELWVPEGATWKWVPVDGDYKYFGTNDANCVISICWPYSKTQNNETADFWNFYPSQDTKIVTNIPCAGLVDSGYTQKNYDGVSPYNNTVPRNVNPRWIG